MSQEDPRTQEALAAGAARSTAYRIREKYTKAKKLTNKLEKLGLRISNKKRRFITG